MSKVSSLINQMKDKLDSISGLDGEYTYDKLIELEQTIGEVVKDITRHSDENELNGTILE